MKLLFQSGRFSVVIALAGLVCFLAQAGGAAYYFSRARDTQKARERAEVRWAQLAQEQVAPSEANLQRLRAERLRLQEKSDALRRALVSGKDAPSVQAYDGPEDLYFEILTLVETLRESAAAAGVALRTGETFGFLQYMEAHRLILPSQGAHAENSEALRAIDRQRQSIAALVPLLLDAGPVALRSVEREPVGVVRASLGRLPPETFWVDVSETAGVPGAVNTTGFRFVFEGRTACLRQFLRSLDAVDLSVVVRSVEVSPLASGSAKDSSSASGRHRVSPVESPFVRFQEMRSTPGDLEVSAVPIVGGNISVFTVVVEAYTLLKPADPWAAR